MESDSKSPSSRYRSEFCKSSLVGSVVLSELHFFIFADLRFPSKRLLPAMSDELFDVFAGFGDAI